MFLTHSEDVADDLGSPNPDLSVISRSPSEVHHDFNLKLLAGATSS